MSVYKEITQLGNKLLPIKIFTTVLDENSRYICPHWHDFVEILYFYKGSATVQINKEYFLAAAGQVVLLNGLDVHSIEGVSEYLVLQFEPQLTSDIYIDFKRIFPLEDKGKVITQGNSRDKYIEAIIGHMKDIVGSYSEKFTGYEMDIRGSIYKIVAAVMAYSQDNSYSMDAYLRHKDNLEKLDKLFQYVEEHYQENINIEAAAGVLNFSPNYFCRFFKKVMGKTFVEYLNTYRCSMAERLINTTNITITEAALSAGFSSVSYFNRLYRRYKGHKPSSERRERG